MNGKMSRIIDGDTFEIRVTTYESKHTGNTVQDLLLKCRIENINSPPINTNIGKLARAFLAEILPIDTEIEFDPNKRDKYGRFLISKIPKFGDISKMIVGNGFAYHYDLLSTDPNLIVLERKAMQNEVGIWSRESLIELYNAPITMV